MKSTERQFALCICGEGGTGKSTFGELFKSLLGSRYEKLELTAYKKDNSHFVDKLIWHFDECDVNKTQANILKDIITSDILTIWKNSKRKDKIPSFARLLITTNNSNFVDFSLEEYKRRFTRVITPSRLTKEEKAHVKEFAGLIQGKTITEEQKNCLKHFFLHWTPRSRPPPPRNVESRRSPLVSRRKVPVKEEEEEEEERKSPSPARPPTDTKHVRQFVRNLILALRSDGL